MDNVLENKEQPVVRVYISGALSGLAEADRDRILMQRDLIMRELGKEGAVFAHCIGAHVKDDDVVVDHDIRCVAHCNLLIILADFPSVGVGQELQIAHACRKRTLVFSRENLTVSHFIRAGASQNKHFTHCAYESLDEMAILALAAAREVRGQLASMFS